MPLPRPSLGEHADIEAYRLWLREGGQGPGPADEERDIVFWI
ncbi:MAG TPA: hypothetical protein VGB96_05170 [Archangium sp.]